MFLGELPTGAWNPRTPLGKPPTGAWNFPAAIGRVSHMSSGYHPHSHGSWDAHPCPGLPWDGHPQWHQPRDSHPHPRAVWDAHPRPCHSWDGYPRPAARSPVSRGATQTRSTPAKAPGARGIATHGRLGQHWDGHPRHFPPPKKAQLTALRERATSPHGLLAPAPCVCTNSAPRTASNGPRTVRILPLRSPISRLNPYI